MGAHAEVLSRPDRHAVLQTPARRHDVRAAVLGDLAEGGGHGEHAGDEVGPTEHRMLQGDHRRLQSGGAAGQTELDLALAEEGVALVAAHERRADRHVVHVQEAG